MSRRTTHSFSFTQCTSDRQNVPTAVRTKKKHISPLRENSSPLQRLQSARVIPTVLAYDRSSDTTTKLTVLRKCNHVIHLVATLHVVQPRDKVVTSRETLFLSHANDRDRTRWSKQTGSVACQPTTASARRRLSRRSARTARVQQRCAAHYRSCRRRRTSKRTDCQQQQLWEGRRLWGRRGRVVLTQRCDWHPPNSVVCQRSVSKGTARATTPTRDGQF